MENNITINMENLTQDERDILLNLIEKANGESKVWKPEKNYWLIDNSGVCNFNYNDDSTDKFLYNIGNCFKTKEEAEFAVEKLKVITEFKRFALENNKCELDWNDEFQEKYSIYYNVKKRKIDIEYWCIYKENTIYFSSKEIAERAIKAIGEDRLKKYYFEVED